MMGREPQNHYVGVRSQLQKATYNGAFKETPQTSKSIDREGRQGGAGAGKERAGGVAAMGSPL
jgi:hypothetical protein